MCVLSIKVPIRKKSGNLFNEPCILIAKIIPHQKNQIILNCINNHIHARTHARTHTHTHMYIYIYIYVCVCVCVCVCVRARACMRLYVYMCPVCGGVNFVIRNFLLSFTF